MGLAAGGVYGAITAAWEQKPVAEATAALSRGLAATGAQDGAIPEVKASLRQVGRHGAIFAAAGGAFAMGECMSEGVRGEKDAFNTFLGGCLAGAVLGTQIGNPVAMAGSCAGVGFAACMMDLASEGRLEQGGEREFIKKMKV